MCTRANDVGYIATVQIGTPPRDFKLLMDSGSSDLWVGSETCVSTSGGDCVSNINITINSFHPKSILKLRITQGNHVFLGTQTSSSFVDTKKAFQVTYGTGAVAGDIVTDDVSVAGLALKAHTFGVATQESVDFSSDQTPFDGLMGLAQSVSFHI